MTLPKAARRLAPFAVLLLAACGGGNSAPEGPAVVQAEDAWCRPTPNGVFVGGCYVTLISSRDDRLVSVASPLSQVVEIHEMRMDGDMMRMNQLADGLPLPAGETVQMRPGAEHLMLMTLSNALEDGQAVPLTLTFEHAAAVTVEAQVRQPEDAGADHGEH
ncbi:MAG: copper chaperone PCu(A)C [Brevundimonas sp.]|uniref:copper chaperone PCu(A)C n=1 Tax=Brevundimonas sp. TaxID=1871086 RepID=UPI00391B457A